MSINILKAQIYGRNEGSNIRFLFPKENEVIHRKKSADLCDKFFYQCANKLNIKEFIECGANEATASRHMSEIGARSIAIEANPVTYKNLTTADHPEYKSLNIGVGDQVGELDFFVPKNSPTAGNATFLKKSGVNYDVHKIPVKPLDQIVSEEGYGDVRGALWIDVEGFCRQLLDGAKNYLSNPNTSLIKIELETFEYFKDQALAEEINNKLHNFDFIPVFCDIESELQFNVIYLRSNCLDILASDIYLFWQTANQNKPSMFELIYLFQKRKINSVIKTIKNASKRK